MILRTLSDWENVGPLSKTECMRWGCFCYEQRSLTIKNWEFYINERIEKDDPPLFFYTSYVKIFYKQLYILSGSALSFLHGRQQLHKIQ